MVTQCQCKYYLIVVNPPGTEEMHTSFRETYCHHNQSDDENDDDEDDDEDDQVSTDFPTPPNLEVLGG